MLIGALLFAAVVPALPAPAGRVEERTVESRVYGRARRVWVYTPPGYDAARRPGYDLLVAFDGREVVEDVGMAAILDRLSAAGTVPACVGVFVDDSRGAERIDELGNRARFTDFLGGELVPWIRQGWNVTSDPRRTTVAGSSAGGLAAAFVAFQRPDLFGNVLSQSGAFWRGAEASNDPPYEWLTEQYANSPKKDIRFVLEVGELESKGALGGAASSILETNRRLRDVLKKKGYDVTYAEVPRGTHSVESWKERLPGALAAVEAARARKR
jgi:enterochelin esterase-like enzyme